MLNGHENNDYFHLLHGNDYTYSNTSSIPNNNSIPAHGMLDSYNRYDPFIQPFLYTNTIPAAAPFDNLAFNYQQFQDYNDLRYQPSTSTYVPAECSSNSMPNYLQGNQQGITQPRLPNFPYIDSYFSNGSFAQNRNNNFM